MLLAHSTNKIMIKFNLIYVDTKSFLFHLEYSKILISYVSAQVSVNSNWSSLRSSWDPHRTEPRYSGNIFSHHVKIFSILLLRAGAAGASAGVGRLHIRQLFLLPGRMRAPGFPSSPPQTVYYSVQISKISYQIKNNE